MKQRLLLSLMAVCIAASINFSWATGAYPGWITVDQPDGTSIELRQMGDEYYHYWQNRDGQEVEQNSDGYWVVKPEQLTEHQRFARRMANPRVASSAPEKTSSLPSRVLVIVVSYSDKAVCQDHQFFDDLMNKDGALSVREYFNQSSDGNYHPQFDVYGPVTLDHPMAYYGANKVNKDDTLPGQLVYDACVKADAEGCNFANYDEDGDGKVDNVNVIFAGYSEAAGAGANCIWPHKWDIYSANRLTLTLDGKQISKYSCSNELRGTSGSNSAGIGTFCHEFSHILGMPDYYDTKSSGNGDKTPKSWSLMDCGNYNANSQRPPLYSIFDKCYMGWASVPSLLPKDAALTFTMPVGTAYAKQITGTTKSKSHTCIDDTIYYIENRQQSNNIFDQGLPGHGMLIWRVIYTSPWSTPNSTAGIVRYTIISARGGNPAESQSDPYPGTYNTTSKTLWPGCAFSQITESNGNISFNYNGGGTTYNHTWMAKGSQFTTTTSRSSLTLPSGTPSAWSGVQFYGWTKQRAMKQDGSDLVLAQTYDEVLANTTFYAVYRTTSTPYRYFYQQNASVLDTRSNSKFVIVEGQNVEIGGQVVNAPGYYPYDTIKTITGDTLLTVKLTWADMNKTIVYHGTKKLDEKMGETPSACTAGLHTDAFGQQIMEHHFSNGIGVIAFNNNLITVGDLAFYGCRIDNNNNQITSVQIPNTVTTFGKYAFSNCWELASVNVPSGVNSIGQGAFRNCSAISITSNATTPPTCGLNCFYGVSAANIYVCPVAESAYKNTTPWSGFTILKNCTTSTTRDTTRVTIPAGGSYKWEGTTYTSSGIYEKTIMDDCRCDTAYRRLELVVLDSAKVIFYTAPQKLVETTGNTGGLNVNAFDQTIAIHTYSNGAGMIAFNNNLTTIGYRAFYGCNSYNNSIITSITIPKTITSIGDQAFYADNALTIPMVIPEPVTSIGRYAFHSCAFTSITCEALTPPTCGEKVFNNINKATVPLYVWPKALSAYQTAAQWSDFTNIHTICDDPTDINLLTDTICQGDSLLWHGKYYKQDIDIIDTIKTIYGCITEIGHLKLTVGEKFDSTEYHALTDGTYTWRGRILTKEGIYRDSMLNRYGCDSVYTLYLMNPTRAIIYTAPAKLKEVTTIANGLNINAFGQPIISHSFSNGTGLIAFANDLTQVGNRAFYGCRHGIDNCEVNSVIFPNTVTTIGDSVFYACWDLASVQLPEELTSLGKYVFRSCTSLTTITCKALTPPACGNECFNAITKSNVTLNVWPSAVALYSADNNWKDFLIQAIGCDNVPDVDTTYTTICPGDSIAWGGKQCSAVGIYSDTLRNIYGCDSAIHRLSLSHYPTYVTPESATFVTGLTYVWRGKNLTEAGMYYDTLTSITYGCDSVIALTLTMTDSTKAIIYNAPNKLVETDSSAINVGGLHVDVFGQPIAAHTFANGVGVIAFNNNLTTVGTRAFYGCREGNSSKVTAVTIPNTVTFIDREAFSNCWELTSVNIPSGVDSIGASAFYNCQQLPSITLPEGLRYLNYSVLRQCSALTTLTIPESVKEMEKNVLANCTGLSSITCKALTPPTTYTESFDGLTKGNITLYVYPSALAAYQVANNWKDFSIQTISCPEVEVVDTLHASVCNGETYSWRGKNYNVAGIYSDTLRSEYGCDTAIHRLVLTVHPKYLFEESDTILEGTTLTWHNKSLTKTGIYYDSLQSQFGCDSVYKLTLTMELDTNIVRIMGIGNSFTMDAMGQELQPIFTSEGKKVILGYPFRGGTWLSQHDAWKNRKDTMPYNYYEYRNGIQTTTGTSSYNMTMAVEKEPWDYVIIQSDHDSAGIYKSYEPYLTHLVDYVKAHCSNKNVKIGFYMTWPYDSISTYSAFKYYKYNNQLMYDSIIACAKRVMQTHPEFFLVPVGTAIQNARTSYLGHTMNRDGYHMNYSYGRYTAALCWYSAIMGKDALDISYVPTSISDYCGRTCKTAVHNAFITPYAVTSLAAEFGRSEQDSRLTNDSLLRRVTFNGMNVPLEKGVYQYRVAVDASLAQVKMCALSSNSQATQSVRNQGGTKVQQGQNSQFQLTTPGLGVTSVFTDSVVSEDGQHVAVYTFSLVGSSTADVVYPIASKEDFIEFAATVNGGLYGINARMMCDINMNHSRENCWETPIGTYEHPYTGTFDGQGYTISGFELYANMNKKLAALKGIGLFGAIQNATIRGIHIVGGDESFFNQSTDKTVISEVKTEGAGILCGYMTRSLIEDCSVTMNLYTDLPNLTIGLICGRDGANGELNRINRCWAAGTWRIRQNGVYGGILGYSNYVEITNCYNLSKMDLQRDYGARIGGLVGYGNTGSPKSVTIKNSYNYGAITDSRGSKSATVYMGAIGGYMNGNHIQTNCYYLNGSWTQANGTGTPTTPTVVSAADMKNGTLATNLGSEFVQGPDYPILRDRNGEFTCTKTHSDLAQEYGWGTSGVYTSFRLGPVTFTTENAETSYKNGFYRNGNEWVLYYQHGNGPLHIQADAGYWIKDVKFKFTEYNNGILSNVTGAGQNKIYFSDSTIVVNNTEKQFYVGNTSGSGGLLGFTEFSVNYCKLPEKVELKDQQLSVGNVFQMKPTILPADAYAAYTWSVDDENIVSIDAEGVVTAKAPGTTNVIAHFTGGITDTCQVVVRANTGATIIETLSNCQIASGNGPLFVVGDQGFYNWQLSNYQRNESQDKVGDDQGTRVRYSGSIATSGLQEGGVKSIAFDWRVTSTTNPVNFRVSVGDKEQRYVTNAIGSTETIQHFAYDFCQSANASIAISVPEKQINAQTYIVVGPITIKPYLLYTNKNVEATDGFYRNADLINNTDVTISSSMISVSDPTAAEVMPNGDIKSLKDNQTVTVTATWGAATTTTTLTTHLLDPAGSFATPTLVTKNIGDADFDNVFTPTVGSNFTYVSADTGVATVDSQGRVHIVNGGTTQIKAVFAAPYKAAEFFYTLDVGHTPAANTYWTEDFANVSKTSTTDTDIVEGKAGVYTWSLKNYQRDNSDLVGGAQGMRLRHPSVWTMINNPEGGIKEVAFDWRASGKDNVVHFWVGAGDNEYEYSRVKVGNTNTIMHFARQFNAKNNVALKFRMSGAQEDPVQTYAIIGPVKIVPYLLYTQKYDTIMVGATYRNTQLIDNRDNLVAITYSITSGSDKATIVGDEVTATKSGDVTVQAQWGEITTTYHLHITNKVLTLSEMDLNTSKIVADTYDSIRLVRTLYNDRYNTFCVPFAVDAAEMDDYFGDYKLYALSSASTGDAIVINFNEVATGIEAGKPYLMEVEENVENPTFTNRTITATEAGADKSGDVTYQGVYCQTLLHRNSTPMEYFLASNNVLYRPVADENMKGLRCYFKINNKSNAPIRMQVNKPSTPTDISSFPSGENRGEATKIMKDGQLLILKDGLIYNAQGQPMK